MTEDIGDSAIDPSVQTRRVNWDLVRIDLEGRGITRAAICRKHGITRAELAAKAKASKWATAGDNETDRIILIGMMLGVLEAQIGNLETTEMTASGDKEVVVLGKLATTLEKLIDIEDKGKAPTEQSGHGENMKDLRNKLARRIDQLKRR
jgi:hypothetical protein